MRYFFGVIADRTKSVVAGPEEAAAINIFNDKIETAGVRIMAAGLAAPGDSKLHDNRDGLGSVRDGFAVDTDLFLAGFWIIETDDDSAVDQLAQEASSACNRLIEVRPFLT